MLAPVAIAGDDLPTRSVPVIKPPAKVGVAAVWMFCGSARVIALDPLVTFTWLVVPVMVATAGSPVVEPINICPLVIADDEVIILLAFKNNAPLAVPVHPIVVPVRLLNNVIPLSLNLAISLLFDKSDKVNTQTAHLNKHL